MNRIKRLFSKESLTTELSPEEDLKSVDEYEIYCNSLSSAEDQDSLSGAQQRGRHTVVLKRGDSNQELLTREVFVHQPPSLIRQPLRDRTLSGPVPAWRLALDGPGEKIYATNNQGPGAYSIFSLHSSEGGLVRTVQCSHIWNIRGIALDASDNVYLSGDHKIQKYDGEGSLVGSFGWSEPGPAWYQFDDPNGLRCRGERVYVCDSRNQRVQVLSLDMEHVGVVGDSSCLTHPEDLEFDELGNMHVLDSGRVSVVVFNSEGRYLRHVAFSGNSVEFPVCLRLVARHYYVTDLGKSQVAVLSGGGELLHEISVRSREEVREDVDDGFVHVDWGVTQRPVGMAVDRNGYIYVCNIDGREIQVF